MQCPAGNATDPIWRVLAASLRISSWTPLKPQHSNLNPNPLANQLWCIDFLTPPTPLIIPHRLPAFLESLMPLKNWCSIHARWSKSSLKHFICFSGIFSKFKTEFYCILFFSSVSRVLQLIKKLAGISVLNDKRTILKKINILFLIHENRRKRLLD